MGGAIGVAEHAAEGVEYLFTFLMCVFPGGTLVIAWDVILPPLPLCPKCCLSSLCRISLGIARMAASLLFGAAC